MKSFDKGRQITISGHVRKSRARPINFVAGF